MKPGYKWPSEETEEPVKTQQREFSSEDPGGASSGISGLHKEQEGVGDER